MSAMNNICIWQLSIWTLSGKPPTLTWKTKTKLWEGIFSSRRYWDEFGKLHCKLRLTLPGRIPSDTRQGMPAVKYTHEIYLPYVNLTCEIAALVITVRGADLVEGWTGVTPTPSEHLQNLIFSETVTNDFLLHHLRLLRYKIWIMVPPTPKIFFLTILQGVYNLHLLFDWWVFEYFFCTLCLDFKYVHSSFTISYIWYAITGILFKLFYAMWEIKFNSVMLIHHKARITTLPLEKKYTVKYV